MHIGYNPYLSLQSIAKFYGLSGGKLGLLQVRDCKGGCKYVENYGPEFGGGEWLRSVTEKTETGGGVRSN